MDKKKAEKCKKSVKIKNPCKICSTTVNPKNGIQCKGACKKWMHYACLNYTPGKIEDIKKGFLKIVCPCPDCQGSGPKEEIGLKTPHKSAKPCCPIVKAPTCDTSEYSGNKKNQEEIGHGEKKCHFSSELKMEGHLQNLKPPECPRFKAQTCPKSIGTPLGQQDRSTCSTTPCKNPHCQETLPVPCKLQLMTDRQCGPPCLLLNKVRKQETSTSCSKADPKMRNQQCGPPCSSQKNQKDVSPNQETQTSPPSSKLCMRKKEDKPNGHLCSKSTVKSMSCSCISNGLGCKKDLKHQGLSTTNLKDASLYENLDDICKTVGHLTTQIRTLMCKLLKQSQNVGLI